MKKYHNIIILGFVFLISTLQMSCKKEWLDIKRDKSLIVPQTLKDMRLLLSGDALRSDHIGVAAVASGEFTVTTERWNTISAIEQKSYLWDSAIYAGKAQAYEWEDAYNQILTTNVILEGLQDIPVTNQNKSEWESVKGGALYMRAKAFFNLAQVYAKPYNSQSAQTELGIPLKMESDINARIVRSTLQQTYDQIIMDLKMAADLLPVSVSFKTDVSRPAAFGLLARIYLSMRKYEDALENAKNSLQLYSTLLNYSDLAPYDTYRFDPLNDEVICFGIISAAWSTLTISRSRLNYVSEELYNSYDDNDLRKQLFFVTVPTGGHLFKGTYQGATREFTGIATDEQYLISAECKARGGDTEGALQDLNTLLEKRFITGTYIPYTAATPEEALEIILTERQKELIGRGIRWSDLRRFNQEPGHEITLTRTINGIDYTLIPNSPRYVFPIPDYIIDFNGIEPN